MRKVLFALLIFSAVFVSCIRDEAPNAECDIENATVSTRWRDMLFYNQSDTSKSIISADSTIVFYIKTGADAYLKDLAVYFKLTAGATIKPANGSTQDFSQGPVRYRVTSEDGMWHRDYLVEFKPIQPITTDIKFEDFELDASQKYYTWFERNEYNDKLTIWATGNPGYKLSKSSAKWYQYHTVPCDSPSVSGHAVKLTTQDTRPFGNLVNMRIAAGNLFIGTFDVSNALTDAMAATRFGLPFNKKPIVFEGYYQYQPGPEFWDRAGNPIEGKIDNPDLYAVLYRNTDENGNSFTLRGDNVLTHPNIVALARLQNPVHGQTWQKFSIPFEYTEKIDKTMLKNYQYNLSVVFTSSIEGAEVRGAIGSTLYVDEVKLICEE